MSKDTNIVINVQDVNKSFRVGIQDVQILKDITFSVTKGAFLIIFGPSGCGKSTLLHTILGLEPPSSGKIELLGEEIYDHKTEDDRADFRKQHVGMVYQQPNWVKSLNVIENVSFPRILLGEEKQKATLKAQEMLKLMGMSDWASYIPTELSSGQQQRVSLARALVTEPEIIICDEPTGNLDYDSGQKLMELLIDLNESMQKTIIMVTHDLEYLKFSKTAIRMLDGKIVETFDESNKSRLLSNIVSKRGNHSIENGDGNEKI